MFGALTSKVNPSCDNRIFLLGDEDPRKILKFFNFSLNILNENTKIRGLTISLLTLVPLEAD